MSIILPEDLAKLKRLRQDIQEQGLDGGMATSEAIETYQDYLAELIARYQYKFLVEWTRQELEEEL